MLRCWRVLLSIAAIVGSAASVANAEDAVPRGKLPEGAAPTHYALDLEVFPSEEWFSGRASIRVELGIATKTIWMHGRGLDASEAYVLRQDGSRVAASFSAPRPGGCPRQRQPVPADRRRQPGFPGAAPGREAASW